MLELQLAYNGRLCPLQPQSICGYMKIVLHPTYEKRTFVIKWMGLAAPPCKDGEILHILFFYKYTAAFYQGISNHLLFYAAYLYRCMTFPLYRFNGHFSP